MPKQVPRNGLLIDVEKMVKHAGSKDWENLTAMELLVLTDVPPDKSQLLTEIEEDPELVLLSWKGGETILHYVAAEGDLALAKRLFQLGASLDAVCERCGTPLLNAAESNGTEMINFLLAKGASPEFVNSGGRTALHYAAHFNNADTTAVLLDHNVPVDIRDSSGNTALDIAAANRYPVVTQLLIDAGATSTKKLAQEFVDELSDQRDD